MRIIHILPHNIEDFISTDYDAFDHHSVRFIERVRKFWVAAHPGEELAQELWVLTKKHDRVFETAHRSGFVVRLFPVSVRLQLPLEISFPMIRFLARFQDGGHTVYHLHGYYLFMHDFLSFILRARGKRFLIQYRGGGPSWTPKAMAYTLYHYLIGLRFDLNAADFAVIQNRDEIGRALRVLWVRPSKIFYMPNSVARDAVPVAPPAHKGVTMVMAGRTEKLKNKEELFVMLARTLDKYKDCKIEFIGAKGGDRSLEQLEGQFPGRVTVLSWVPKAELRKRLAETDIFLHTNTKKTYEGSPMTLVEAQAEGNAAVAFDIEGVRDIIMNGENGFLSRDYEDFESALDTLIANDRLREDMRRHALAVVRENFTDERYFPGLITIYSHLSAQS